MGYAAGTHLISAAHQHLANLAGTGHLDPAEVWFLQEGLEGIYDALYMGTVSAVRGQEGDLEDDNTYSDGRRVTIKTRNEPVDESVNGWKHNQFLSKDGAIAVHPPGATSSISPPNLGQSIAAWGESEFLTHFYEARAWR